MKQLLFFATCTGLMTAATLLGWSAYSDASRSGMLDSLYAEQPATAKDTAKEISIEDYSRAAPDYGVDVTDTAAPAQIEEPIAPPVPATPKEIRKVIAPLKPKTPAMLLDTMLLPPSSPEASGVPSDSSLLTPALPEKPAEPHLKLSRFSRAPFPEKRINAKRTQ